MSVDPIENLKQQIITELAQKEGRPIPGPGQCPFCGKDGPFKFKDELSAKEGRITGLCQECQDKMYSGAEP